MSPKSPRNRGLAPKVLILEGGGTFKRWGPVRGPQITGGALEGDWGSPPLSSSSLVPRCPAGELFCPTRHSCCDVLPHQRSTVNRVTTHGLKPSETWGRINDSSLHTVLWILLYSDRKLTNTNTISTQQILIHVHVSPLNPGVKRISFLR